MLNLHVLHTLACRLGRSASARALEGAVIRDVLSGVLPPEIAAAELELDEVRQG